MTDGKLKIYGDSISGNCYKLQLLCAEMGIDYEWQEVDILSGATRTDAFLSMNPNGKIPLLELPDGRHLAESNAILCYIADGSEYVAGDTFTRAEIMQWLFFEQYSHEPYIATSRFIVQYLGSPSDRQSDLEQKRDGGWKALGIMEKQLQYHDYLVADRYSIADIALFAYTHVSDEGGFPLGNYPAIRGWIDRVKRHPGFVPMKKK